MRKDASSADINPRTPNRDSKAVSRISVWRRPGTTRSSRSEMERGIILAALVGLLVTAGVALILDGRQRRMNKRLAAIMPTVAPVDAPAFARVRQGGGYASSSIRGLVYRLFRYDPRAV